MENLKSKALLTQEELDLVPKYFTPLHINAQTNILHAGERERYVYFLSQGIVKGYQNINGKTIIEHLIDEDNFFSSIDSFMNETPSIDYFETVTDCKVLRISKPELNLLNESYPNWKTIVDFIFNEHLVCKMERVRDFQTLTAKQRYLKFIEKTPNLALKVSIENIASFLGMEPQSLSRIRNEIVF